MPTATFVYTVMPTEQVVVLSNKAKNEKAKAKLADNLAKEIALPPEEQIATLRRNIANLEQKLYQVSKKQLTETAKLKEIHEPSLKKSLSGVSKRLKELDGLVHQLINKETILTEVSMYVRKKDDWALMAQFHVAIMMAYNQDTAWWGNPNGSKTIGEWYTKIMKLLENDNEKQ